MYNRFYKFEPDYLAKAQSLPQNTNADGNGGAFNLSGAGGKLEIKAVVNTAITFANTKALTVKLQHSDNGTDYTDLITVYTLTASADTTLAAGAVLGSYIVPNEAKPYIKVNIATTDSAAAGKIDVFPILNE